MPICGTCRRRCSGSSRSMARGDGPTWRCSSSPRGILEGTPDRHLQRRRDVPRFHLCRRSGARHPPADRRRAGAARDAARISRKATASRPSRRSAWSISATATRCGCWTSSTAIEAECGREAVRNYMPMQQGDVPATWADASLLKSLTGYAPQTPFREGVARFVAWYRDYYRV